METVEREARLRELFAAGWTTELFAEFWKAPDLSNIPTIITDDVVGYWPGGRTVRGRADYMKALKDLLAALPDLRLDVKEHTMSADGEFGFTRWVMHATGANGPVRAGRDGPHARARRARLRELRLLRLGAVRGTRRRRERHDSPRARLAPCAPTSRKESMSTLRFHISGTGAMRSGRAGGATTRRITARSSSSPITPTSRSRWKAARRSTS
jgi:ketosteroid isomerase-like protein